MMITSVRTTRIAFSILAMAYLGLLNPASVPAQEEDTETRAPTQEDILLFLANEKVVAPGVGFINGQLGDSMNYILEVWGEPVDARKVGYFGEIEVLYRPDPNTAVVFAGKDEIRSISIKGNPASLIRTRRGVRFGLGAINVFRIYSQYESQTIRERVEFPSLGISFYFDEDKRVETMVIYPPEN